MVYRYQDLTVEDRAIWSGANDYGYTKISVGVVRTLNGDLQGAALISHLAFRSRGFADKDGWFCITQDDIEHWTGLSGKVQLKARQNLEALGVLESKRYGVPARLHYRVEVQTFIGWIKSEILREEESSSAQRENLDSPNGIIQFRPTGGTGPDQRENLAAPVGRNINKEVNKSEVTGGMKGTGIGIANSHSSGAKADSPAPEPGNTEAVQARLSSQNHPLTPPSAAPPADPRIDSLVKLVDEFYPLRPNDHEDMRRSALAKHIGEADEAPFREALKRFKRAVFVGRERGGYSREHVPFFANWVDPSKAGMWWHWRNWVAWEERAPTSPPKGAARKASDAPDDQSYSTPHYNRERTVAKVRSGNEYEFPSAVQQWREQAG